MCGDVPLFYVGIYILGLNKGLHLTGKICLSFPSCTYKVT